MVLFLAALTAGCSPGQGGKPASTPRPSVSASAGVSEATWVTYWARLGVSPAPPRDVADRVPTAPAVRNLTNGGQTDVTARAWLKAYLRSEAVRAWLAANLEAPALRAPGNPIGDPNPALDNFGSLLRFIDKEKARGALEVRSIRDAVISDAAIVPVTDTQMGRVTPPKRLTGTVLRITVRGPSSGEIRYVDGHTAAISGLSDGQTAVTLVAGRFVTDSVLGELWYTTSSWNCGTNEEVRALCDA